MLSLNHSLQHSNTFGLNIKTRYYAEVTSPDDLQKVLNEAPAGTPVLPLGSGSNILFTSDFDGLVIRNVIKGIEVLDEGPDEVTIRAGAGEIWHELVLFCVNRGYAGIENLSLIPGTVGAAPMQNIGAYGTEVKDVLESVEYIRMDTGKIVSCSNAGCRFGYRDSIFKHELKGLCFISGITIKLKKNAALNTSYAALSKYLEENHITPRSVKDISDAVIAIRQSKLPDPAVLGNAGSFFKNPEIPASQYDSLKKHFPDIPGYPVSTGLVKVPAGWLIEQCGWKGKVVGNTGCHKMQALVIVNYGGASGSEIRDFAYSVIASVKEKFGISLLPEVNII